MSQGPTYNFWGLACDSQGPACNPKWTGVSPSHAWLPPEHHDVKMNVDAGFSKIGDDAAAVVVCIDKRGNYLGVSAIIYDGCLDATILEAQACCEALSLASDLQVQSICVASDCLEVVRNIQDEVPCRYFSILLDIKHEGSHFQDVKFLHENRKHNGEAHALAKVAVSLSPGRHVWLSILPEIICIPMCLNF